MRSGHRCGGMSSVRVQRINLNQDESIPIGLYVTMSGKQSKDVSCPPDEYKNACYGQNSCRISYIRKISKCVGKLQSETRSL